jgi:hypothetical protein
MPRLKHSFIDPEYTKILKLGEIVNDATELCGLMSKGK